MKKLIRGIVDFREQRRAGLAATFAQLALGQRPDALFITCSDSRVAVNVFASTDPGDLFVLRNVGNLAPAYDHPGAAGTAAAVDFAVDNLHVQDVIVCGHSDCGAMRAHCQGHSNLPAGPLRTWLEMAATGPAGDVNEASRANVLEQIRRLKTYPSVARGMAEWGLQLHGLWFDIPNLDVLYFDGEWRVIDRENAERILRHVR